MHERGQITGFGLIERMRDADEGDQAQVERLRRRAGSLRRQIAEASELIAPPQQREADPVAAAASRARSVLAEVTRSQVAGTREWPCRRSGPLSLPAASATVTLTCRSAGSASRWARPRRKVS